MDGSKKAVRDFMICIALGFVIYIPLISLVFSAIRKAIGSDVILGALYGSAVMLLYYFMFARAISNAAGESDPEAAKKRIQAAYSLRMFVLVVLMGAGVFFATEYAPIILFHWCPVIASMIVPRISIAVWQIIQKIKNPASSEKDGEDKNAD